jgi:ADP-ribose pyrophosphatase
MAPGTSPWRYPAGWWIPVKIPCQAGVRELLEETGYGAREVSSLGWVHPNPALFNNRCHTIWAKGAVKTGPQQLDDAEDIQVLLRPLKDLPALVTKGKITHSLVIAALSLFWLERGGID